MCHPDCRAVCHPDSGVAGLYVIQAAGLCATQTAGLQSCVSPRLPEVARNPPALAGWLFHEQNISLAS